MKLILCLDDKNGMLFNGRRQSRDREVCRDILDVIGQNKVWMRDSSKKLFDSEDQRICVFEDDGDFIGDTEYLFIETDAVEPLLPSVDVLIIYRWNRIYPADVSFPAEVLVSDWKLVETYEFTGHSHDVLKREVYVR